MYLSVNWLKKFVSLPTVSPEQLALDLTMSTVEVEQWLDQKKSLAGLVIGRIKELVKHPQADRLWICKTDIGGGQTLQIVCGGSNLKDGQLVAVAQVGSLIRWHGQGELVKLEAASIRGQQSQGMIVAASEVGLTNLFPARDEHEIIDLSQYNFKVGTPLAQALGLDDIILEIDNKSMTHRPDLWGHYGLAREVAAIYDKKFKPLKLPAWPKVSRAKKLKVEVETDKCPRYSAIIIDQLSIEPSPWWLKRSLEAVGVRSINNIVDVTNYVMLELGQPLHAFDHKFLDGQTIKVKELKNAESFQTLDGQRRRLASGTVMIADGKQNIAIAGLMGGLNSEIKANTKTIVLESANFQASAIRLASLKLGLRTEASARFEKALDPNLTVSALQLAWQLIKAVCPTAVLASQVHDHYRRPLAGTKITMPKDLIDRLLGVTIDSQTVKAILTRLQFKVRSRQNNLEITVPTWRATKDITRPEDIVEEVARIYGYGKIKPRLPLVSLTAPDTDDEQRLAEELKDRLALTGGYYEILNYSFADPLWQALLGLDKDQVEVKNYLTADQRYLRTSLLPGLLRSAEANSRWSDDFQLFEFGRTFVKQPGGFSVDNKGQNYLPEQLKYFAGVSVSKQRPAAELYLEVKGLLTALLNHYKIDFSWASQELPFSQKRLVIKAHDQKFGSIGLLDERLQSQLLPDHNLIWWELNFSKLVKHADFSRLFSALPRFPTVVRDLAVVLEQTVSWEKILAEVKAASPLIQSVELFDIYQSDKLGAGRRSLAFSLVFRSEERTLSSGEVDKLVAKIMANLKKKFKASPR